VSAPVRLVLAAVLAYVALVGVPKVPTPVPVPPSPAPAIVVDVPSADMQRAVTGVAESLRGANPVDRALWAATMQKLGIVAKGDNLEGEVVLSDTRSMRLFTVLGLDIAWRRIGGNAPGKYPGLREAVETAFAEVIGMDVRPVTPELRAKYAELCNALAWCGVGRE
jgi:hypothetical protein